MTNPDSRAFLNPMQNPEGFKLGVFAYVHEGGVTITKVPERWSARWPDIAAMAQVADRGGMDFLLPLARWKGIPGDVDNRHWSFETLTQAAALSGITERISLLSTVHTPVVHPVYAAKAMATIDHASGGRAGLNIVCGWNKADYDMFGLQLMEHDDRYVHGMEWYEIWSRLVRDTNDTFDYDGKYFMDLKGISGMPGTVQQPQPTVISAGYSPAGRDYAVRTADYFLTVMVDEEEGARGIADIREREKRLGRRAEPLKPIGVAYVVCRETREEAEAFHHYYAVENADTKGVDHYVSARAPNADTPEPLIRELRMRWAAGNSAYPLVGSPKDIVDGLLLFQQVGFHGAALSFVNYLDELPFFIERVLPLAREAGL